MEKVSYHTHSTISDGRLSPEELIKLSIQKNFKVLAITDHYKYPKNTSIGGWGRTFYSEENYKELKRLKQKYKSKIKILIGAEFDWYPKRKKWIFEQVKSKEWDIKIISLHRLYFEGKYYPLNYTEDFFKEILQKFKGNIRKMISYYYKELRNAIKTRWFDIVGHLDLIKAFNKDSKYFSENEKWYKKEIKKTLKSIKKANLKMEVNLQGLIMPCKEQYPSKWIIDKAKKLGIGLTIGTDAHRPEELDYDPKFVEQLLD